ncbi:MAG TPA: response regulator [bacterium]|nr:response regulator [bacterium]HQG46768.1 response regulator [bacterium]HQI49689.1 response regulator [bacterium]HQJ65857.1 response regulator [bacterium]
MKEKKRILLVDDDPDFVEINRMILEAAEYEVDAADSVARALQMLNEADYDVLVIDLMMEERDSGFTLTYAVRNDERLRHLPILMLTSAQEKTGFSFQFSEDKEWMKVDDFASKPLKPADLVARIGRLITKGVAHDPEP